MYKKFLLSGLIATLHFGGGVCLADTDTPDEKSADTEVPFEESISDDDRFKDFNFSIEARYFAPHFDAKVQSDKINYNGGKVGLKDNLGFGNDKAPELILRYKRLSLDYIYVHGTGHTWYGVGNTLTYGGKRYQGDVKAENTLHYIKLNVTNPIKVNDDGGLTWSYGVTGLLWKGKVKGDAKDSNNRTYRESRSESYGAPIPTLGLGVHANLLPQFNAYANISGLYAGHYGHFYDLEAGIRFKPVPHFAITAGYRKIEAKVHHKDDFGKFKMHGPFAGLRFDF